ncbi:Hypothetical_protein [Hexamita inflata]|uniref:Hypothetical_protein n=1 Tax=Hexamita inflata TaxID=28002 RepID=A0ABP1JA13_9EUKA
MCYYIITYDLIILNCFEVLCIQKIAAFPVYSALSLASSPRICTGTGTATSRRTCGSGTASQKLQLCIQLPLILTVGLGCKISFNSYQQVFKKRSRRSRYKQAKSTQSSHTISSISCAHNHTLTQPQKLVANNTFSIRC